MRAATAVAVLVMVYLLVIPLAVQVVSAVRGTYLPFGLPSSRWGLHNFADLYGGLGGDLLRTLRDTALFVGGSTLVAVLAAWGLAWLVVRTDLPGRNVITMAVIVPFVIPPIVRAQGYLLMLAPKSGVLNQMLRAAGLGGHGSGPIDPFDFATMTVVQGLANVAFPFLLLMPIMQNMGRSHEEAARASGASAWQTFRRVTLPMLWPGTLGVVVLLAMLLFGNLEVPLLFGQQEGGHIFSLKLWKIITPSTGELPRYGLAAAYSANFLVIVVLLFRVYLWATRGADRRAAVTGKDYRPVRLPLGRFRYAALALVALYLVPTTILPLLALLWSAVTPYAMPVTWSNLTHHLTGGAFSAALGDHEFWASLGRTAVIAVSSATLAVAVAMVVAYTTARTPGKRRRMRALDALASSSLAIPATMVGFSAFLLYSSLNRWVPLMGTIWVLVLAYSYRVSVAYRISYSAVLQINPELEDAGSAAGASRFAVFRRIVVPLLMPAAFGAWIQMVIMGANEFTLPAFLATPESRPLSWYLYSRIDPESAQLYAPGQGAAMAVIFTVCVLVAGYGLRLLTTRRTSARTLAATVPAAPAEPAAPVVTAASPVPDRAAR
ncbi:ABC transporter permease [Actinomadura violacea]|uniref:Iron ABC transporter permease n=1 Tax=Actinomadura violacea TaxID=2819934 RepID=A0ABS3S7D3_9ACTN|nr:ABC transporter permease subunit [Actinomadura violacea]MBO2464900.1 iron ABC transporter permease [Actinomadura violacea]